MSLHRVIKKHATKQTSSIRYRTLTFWWPPNGWTHTQCIVISYPPLWAKITFKGRGSINLQQWSHFFTRPKKGQSPDRAILTPCSANVPFLLPGEYARHFCHLGHNRLSFLRWKNKSSSWVLKACQCHKVWTSTKKDRRWSFWFMVVIAELIRCTSFTCVVHVYIKRKGRHPENKISPTKCQQGKEWMCYSVLFLINIFLCKPSLLSILFIEQPHIYIPPSPPKLRSFLNYQHK